MAEGKKPFHQRVAEKLIEQLKQGTAPWQKPWDATGTSILPMNPTTGNRYRGVNVLNLMAEGRDDNRWMTYKQAESLGAQVRKGERGTLVQYWQFDEKQPIKDDQGKPMLDSDGKPMHWTVQLERPRAFYAVVFNAEQIDGLAASIPAKAHDWNPIERAEALVQASGAKITEQMGDWAFYRPSTDSITLPARSQFPSADRFYATALHEIGHWTGSPDRLNRDLSHPFGSEGYAREELRAEIASLILGQELQIGHDPEQHAAYVGSWIKALEEDPLEIVRAASDAEKIYSYILAFEQKQVQEIEQTQNHTQYFVSNENTLCYQQPGMAMLGVLASNIDGRNPINGPFYASPLDQIRPATREDFDRFRVALPPDFQQAQEYRQNNLDEGDRLALADMAKTVRAYEEWQNGPHFEGNEEADLVISDDLNMELDERVEAAFARPGLAAALNASGFTVERLTDHSGNRWAAAAGAVAAIGDPMPEPQQHYSDRTLRVLIDKHGWEPVDSGGPTHSVRRQFEGVGPIGTMMTPNGERNLMAGYSEDSERRRYIALSLGPNQITDFDGRNQNPEDIARLINLKAEQYADERREKQGLAPRYAVNSLSLNIDANDPDSVRNAAVLVAGYDAERANAVVLPLAGYHEAAPELSTMAAQRTNLAVPYRDKDEAKALGAKWDKVGKTWFVPAGGELAPFAKWISSAAEAPKPQPGQTVPVEREQRSMASQTPQEGHTMKNTPRQGREYLAVPYGERELAKANGAKWDAARKSWYAPEGSDPAKFERWMLNNQPRQNEAKAPEVEFGEAMKALGLQVPAGHPIMDGKTHRVPAEGDSKGETAGFYVAFTDGHPAGYIKNNRSGLDMRWKSTGYSLSNEEKARLNAEAATKREERDREREATYSATADRVQQRAAQCSQIEQATPYMERKGITPTIGALGQKGDNTIHIPAIDTSGKHWTTQYIQEDGTKRFAKDSHKEGCFHVVNGGVTPEAALAALDKAPRIMIGEGYATMATVSSVVDHATVAAFDSGNLPAVAAALRERYPDKPIFIMGEDDQRVLEKFGYNPGTEKANAAAKAVDGIAVFPTFAPGEQSADPARFTDFNDLQQNSRLGREGVVRQIRAAIENPRQQEREAPHIPLEGERTRERAGPVIGDDQSTQRRSVRR